MANVSVGTEGLIDTVVDRFGNATPTRGAPSYIELGRGSQTPSVTSTSITTPVPITYTAVDDCNATTGWSATTDGSVALNTTSGEYIEGTGCLNLVKSGTTATSVTYSKTTTSVDFTSKQFWAWLYITALSDLVASGTAVEVRFGSDSSNYYYKRYTAADLAAGTNWLYFSSATATGTTGSPSISACDYTAIVLTVDAAGDTFTGNRIRLDHVQVSTAAQRQNSHDAGYPSTSSSANKVQSANTIDILEAIGQNITNSGWYGSTGELLGIDSFTSDQKTQEEQWQFVEDVLFVNIP